MPRKDKYYGTYINLHGLMLKKIRKLGYKGYHAQFRIVCKAKSRAEANRIGEKYGLGEKAFVPNYTSETANETAINMADKYGLTICLNGTTGRNYIDIRSIL
ncbi:hypothetical protein AB8U03_15505 [Clostridium sp. Mt-5]|uniref:Uncharacterized protein n=1 Tax=Clostridium moutaii TaxID=3240932 RepID=A0ABV4BVP9_9CLOT